MSLIKVSIPAKVADADKSEELEREIKGDVVAVVSGNAARVSKDVSFATAKEGVESFARKNGVSVVASQEYGEAYKFKFSAAIDCATDAAAQDASAFPLAEKASRIVKGIMSQVKRVEDEAEAAFRNAKTAEEKNAAQRDAVAIHNIMEKLEIAASYA